MTIFVWNHFQTLINNRKTTSMKLTAEWIASIYIHSPTHAHLHCPKCRLIDICFLKIVDQLISISSSPHHVFSLSNWETHIITPTHNTKKHTYVNREKQRKSIKRSEWKKFNKNERRNKNQSSNRKFVNDMNNLPTNSYWLLINS